MLASTGVVQPGGVYELEPVQPAAVVPWFGILLGVLILIWGVRVLASRR